MDDLSRIVGENQKRLRAERGFSLDALAKQSGVSKSRLGQIERGEANPSISTLWQIANSLHVEFSVLVSPTHDTSRVVSKREVEPVTGDEGAYRAFPLFPLDPALGFEFYAAEIDAGGQLSAQPHPVGTQETLMVVAGKLALVTGNDECVLHAGDAMRFRADQPHGYRNPGAECTEFVMIVAYRRNG